MITRKKFDEGNFQQKKKETNVVLEFLKSKPDYAFEAKEIAEKLKISVKTVRWHLRNLKKKRLLDHKKPFYSIKQQKK